MIQFDKWVENKPFKADWKAYSTWREEAELRKRKRLRSESQAKEKENKQTNVPENPQERTNPLNSSLTEVHKSWNLLDPDLESAPPPPYAPDQIVLLFRP